MDDEDSKIRTAEAIAVLRTRIDFLETKLNTVLMLMEDLTAERNRTKGALWVLVTIGGLAGALISNLKSIFSIFSQG